MVNSKAFLAPAQKRMAQLRLAVANDTPSGQISILFFKMYIINALFINQKHHWKISASLFLLLPASPLKSVGTPCPNQPHGVRSSRRNEADTKIPTHRQ